LTPSRETPNASRSSETNWFAVNKPNPQAALRLFCFPYAGGNHTLFHNWSRHLPSTVELCAAQLPGRGSRLRERPFTSLPPLVESLGQAIVPLSEKPFAFFGHSMGASIAFELARYLRRERGVSPQHLFVSGRRAPQVPKDEPPIYNLPQDEFIEELRRLDGTPTEVLEHPELMALMTPLLRADFSIVDTYEYTPDAPLDCGITAYGGLQDNEVSREKLEAWREQTRGRFTLRMLPGGHFFLQSEQQALLRSLHTELHQVVLEASS
jgi:medium-chain acyl-[acyl-carrier-protein] hydrolase